MIIVSSNYSLNKTFLIQNLKGFLLHKTLDELNLTAIKAKSLTDIFNFCCYDTILLFS